MQSSDPLHRLRRSLNDGLRRLLPGNSPDHRADDSDISYNDALLDNQLRNFFKAEYGRVQPPSGVFPKLLAAIRSDEHGERPSLVTRPAAAFSAVYRALHTSAAHRLVSGAVAAILLIAVLSSNSISFQRGAAVSFVHGETSPTPSAEVNARADLEIATSRDDRYVLHLPPVASDPAFYDPVERRMPIRAVQAGANAAPSRWQRMGGQ